MIFIRLYVLILVIWLLKRVSIHLWFYNTLPVFKLYYNIRWIILCIFKTRHITFMHCNCQFEIFLLQLSWADSGFCFLFLTGWGLSIVPSLRNKLLVKATRYTSLYTLNLQSIQCKFYIDMAVRLRELPLKVLKHICPQNFEVNST